MKAIAERPRKIAEADQQEEQTLSQVEEASDARPWNGIQPFAKGSPAYQQSEVANASPLDRTELAREGRERHCLAGNDRRLIYLVRADARRLSRG